MIFENYPLILLNSSPGIKSAQRKQAKKLTGVIFGYVCTVPAISLNNSVYPLKGNAKERNKNEKYFCFNVFYLST